MPTAQSVVIEAQHPSLPQRRKARAFAREMAFRLRVAVWSKDTTFTIRPSLAVLELAKQMRVPLNRELHGVHERARQLLLARLLRGPLIIPIPKSRRDGAWHQANIRLIWAGSDVLLSVRGKVVPISRWKC